MQKHQLSNLVGKQSNVWLLTFFNIPIKIIKICIVVGKIVNFELLTSWIQADDFNSDILPNLILSNMVRLCTTPAASICYISPSTEAR